MSFVRHTIRRPAGPHLTAAREDKDNVKHATEQAVLQCRFGLAFLLVQVGFTTARIALRLLPEHHPSRVYLDGRTQEGKDRAAAALRPFTD